MKKHTRDWSSQNFEEGDFITTRSTYELLKKVFQVEMKGLSSNTKIYENIMLSGKGKNTDKCRILHHCNGGM